MTRALLPASAHREPIVHAIIRTSSHAAMMFWRSKISLRGEKGLSAIRKEARVKPEEPDAGQELVEIVQRHALEYVHLAELEQHTTTRPPRASAARLDEP